MGTVSIDYPALDDAYREARRAVQRCETYVNDINKRVTQKLSSLTLGSSTNTSQANYFARSKINDLNQKKKKYETFANKVRQAREYAKETDENVSRYIRKASLDFRNSHDMKVGVITALFAWTTTEVLNKTVFGRWLNQTSKDVGTWLDGARRKFKESYELDGGKYIVKTVLAVIGTVVAVAMAYFAFPALIAAISVLGTAIAAGGIVGIAGALWTVVTAAASVITAVIGVANGVIKSIYNTNAALSFQDDPGWAKHYNSFTSLSEYFRKNYFKSPNMNRSSYGIAQSIDGVETAAKIIDIADMIRNGIHVFSGEKIDVVLNKVHFKNKDGKVTFATIKYGMKNLKGNAKEIKQMVKSTNVSRLQTYYKEQSKLVNFYKKMKSIEGKGRLIESIADKGVGTVLVDKVKEKLQSYSTVYEYTSRGKGIFENLERLKKNSKPRYEMAF